MTSKLFATEKARRLAADRQASRANVHINKERLQKVACVIGEALTILRAPAFDRAGACNCWKRARRGQNPFADLFSVMRLSMIGQFTERVIVAKRRILDPAQNNADPQTGKPKRPSTATAFAWSVWERLRGFEGPPSYNARSMRFEWIPPCRAALERSGDYPEVAV